MSREQITSVGGAAALLIPEDALKSLGLNVGDEVDVTITGGRLILRSLDELEREVRIRAAADNVFERRQSAYHRLAEGAGQ